LLYLLYKDIILLQEGKMRHEIDRDKLLKELDALVEAAKAQGKHLKCLGHNATFSPESIENADEVNRGMYSKCNWVLVDPE
jgi:hypothetical protein